MATGVGRLVVVGASLAGLRAVEAVRRDGFDGTVTLIGAEEHLPYDRPPLSKDYLADPELADPTYRSEDELASELGVELVLGDRATALDTAGRAVTVGGREIGYDGLVLATGADARTLPGLEGLAGVHTLRTLDDSRRLRAELREGARTMTVVGAGFIGSEIAAVARKLGLEATIVEALPTPLSRAVGERMGRVCTRLHERHGTTVLTGVAVEEVLGSERSDGSEGGGRVTGVRLADGRTIDTDVLVVGVGARPATGWLEGSGLTLDDGVVCDATLAAAPGVYAAGDVARWHNGLFGESMRLEHWTSAAEQGARAARNAVDPGSATAYETVPYFWSDWYDSRIQFVGIADADEVRVVAGPGGSDGSEGEGPVTALYRRGDRVVGALAIDMRAEVMKYRRLVANRAGFDEALQLAESRRDEARAKARAKARAVTTEQ